MTVIHSDCLDAMRAMPADSVDSIVSDPPYGLAFMGKAWDHGVPGEPFWREALRVAKPGAHLVAFGGTRTYHRLACAIEDAGWEIRDCLSWLYGSGFPKSLDVGKAIDKSGGGSGMPENDRKAFAKELRTAREAKGLSRDDLAAWFPQYSEVTRNWERLDVGFRVPSEADYGILVERLGISESWRLRVRAEDKRRLVSTDGIDRRDDGTVIGLGHTGRQWEATTDLARQWQGWGTALKPAWEPIILARKPLIGTVAANVAAHGTGALNVDGCRIGTGEDKGEWPITQRRHADVAFTLQPTLTDKTQGRWPANVVLDEDAAAMLDAQSGDRPSTGTPTREAKRAKSASIPSRGVTGWADGQPQGPLYSDAGGASRFFYTAKANRREREAGLEGMPEKENLDLTSGDRNRENERAGTNRNCPLRAANHHPTVKPIALMRWLCRLVTPPNGLVLDPFTGSGTTGCAAVLEGFRFLGCEREAEYVAIAEKRIAHWAGQKAPEPEPSLF